MHHLSQKEAEDVEVGASASNNHLRSVGRAWRERDLKIGLRSPRAALPKVEQLFGSRQQPPAMAAVPC